MREHKYQVWDKKNKRMIEQDNINYIDFDEGEVSINELANPEQINEIENRDYVTLMFKDIELREWTGLKDKNGKDIYDGDIVRLNGWVDYKHYTDAGSEKDYIGIFLIEVEIGTFGVKVDWTSISGYSCPTHIISNNGDGKLKNAEIIGNIYENPELLEGKK